MVLIKIWSVGIIFLLVAGCGGNDSKNSVPLLSFNTPSEVAEGSLVTLVSSSTDMDGYIVSHEWAQLSGPSITLGVVSETTVTFFAPDVSEDQELEFSLRIVDDSGAEVVKEGIFLTVLASLADSSKISASSIVIDDTNESPFIASIDIAGDLTKVQQVKVSVLPKTGANSDPFVTRFLPVDFSSNEELASLPVVGLYEDFTNTIEISLLFEDDSNLAFEIQVEASKFYGPFTLEVTHAVNPSMRPAYSFFYLQSPANGPTIVDIDGEFRWVELPKEPLLDPAPTGSGIGQSILEDNGKFVVAVENKIGHIALDGSSSFTEIKSSSMTEIRSHHDLDKGKFGYLVEIDATYLNTDTRIIESILIDVNLEGDIFNTWDFGRILSDYMIENGDDPSMFIRDGHDWFHINSAIYYEKGNSLIVSSRENFVIAIDYDTSKIKWLLGDETKHWYVNFPSLRNLSLSSSDVKPIGQHSLSMVDRGLLLFNNGQASFQQPDGEPAGKVLETSAASIYEIDEEAKSALLIWDYDAGIYSDICSSVYEFNQSDEYLITYTAAGRLNKDEPYYAYIQSIDHSGSLLFELKLSQANPYCATAFQASPLTLN